MNKIIYKQYSEKYLPFKVKWLNNCRVNRFIGDGKGTTLKKEREWLKNYKSEKTKIFFLVIVDSIPIGMVGLHNISKINQNADLFILIGEDKYRRKGFGKKSLAFIINYAFSKLKLHKLSLGVFEKNTVAVNLYKTFGFITEGILKDEVFLRGKYHNQINMALFNKKRIKRK